MRPWIDRWRVAGHRLLLRSFAGEPVSLFPYDLGEFREGRGERSDLVIEFRPGEEAGADPLKWFFPAKFRLERGRSVYRFLGVDGRARELGWISTKADRGVLGVPPLQGPWRVEEEREAVREALHSFIKACLQLLLLREGGSLLHAAGIVEEGKGYLFCGPTRSGKTTIASSFPPSCVVGDDLVALRPASESGRPLLYGTPWPGREGGKTGYGGVPAEEIFLLRPGETHGIREAGKAEAVAELLAGAPRLGYGGEENDLLEVFSRLAGRISIHLLSLPVEDDPRLWLERHRKGERSL